jgi:hypothetical protein
VAVSLFQDLRERSSCNSNWQFRPLAQLQARLLFAETRETAQQQPISITKAKACLFQPGLKQREIVCNRQHIKPGA